MPGYAPSLGSGSSMGTQAGTFGGGSSSGSTTGSSSRPGRTEPGQRSNLAAANEAQFFSEQGITSTNPFGKQGFFSKFFGIDPKNISYANIMSPNQMANVAALNYDRYANPFAEVNVLGNPTGANPELGVVRSGLKSGDVTALGTVKSVAQPKSPMIKGIASFLPGATTANILNALMPAPTVNMIEGAGMAGTGIPSAFAEQERMGRLTERTGSYSQPSGLSQMVSDMMNFFSPNQQTTNIQPSDVSTGMSAYSEIGRPASGVPQLGVTSYGSPMAQITAPATTQFSGNTDAISRMMNETARPDRADMMAFNFSPTASSQVAVEPGQAMSPSSNLTTTKAQEQAIASSRQAASLSNAPTISLELSYSEASPAEQAMIAAELQQRASKGDEYAGSLVEVLGPSGVPAPPARPGRFLGSVGQPLNLIPSSFDILGNPAL